MNKYLIGFLVILGLLGTGYGIGRYATPEKVVTKVETIEVIKEKIVEKIVYKEGIKKQTKTIITEHPDGLKITEIFEVFESTVFVESQNTIDLREEVKSLKEQTVTNSKAQWKVSGIYQFPDVYGLQIDRRIIGPFFLGASGNTDKKAAISIGMEF